MNKIYLTNQTPINFSFNQSQYSFKVTENIKFKLQKRGNYKIVEVTKKEKSTIELVEYLSEVFKIDKKEIGYAGLKDKHATTTQILSLPKYIRVEKFINSDSVEIKELGLSANPIKIGDLNSNSFSITLTDVTPKEYSKMLIALDDISKNGFANFFGYQRFGKENESSVEKGLKIAQSGQRVKNQRGKILVASYQSKHFNLWLNRRLEISKLISSNKKDTFLEKLSPKLYKAIKESPTLFKLLPGDLGYTFKSGRKNFSSVYNIEESVKEFAKRRFYPTGLLFGSSVRVSSSIAKEIEKEFIDQDFSSLRGTRRAAWIWPKDLRSSYNEKKQIVRLNFTLLPGSYATVLLEELANKELKD